jgi:dTDP-4-dehydrorhamnose 3,5-epimerase
VEIEPTAIPDVLAIRPRKFEDARGFFSEVFRDDRLKAAGVDQPWVQDNHSFSSARGVVRGLHFQSPPFAQAKLVRVTRGAVLDVAVDLRRSSATFGKHVAVELSAEAWNQLYVPTGFAHGFCTLKDNTEVLYKVTAHYAPTHEGGLLWNDSDLGIDWPVAADDAQLTDRDRTWPRLRDLDASFSL